MVFSVKPKTRAMPVIGYLLLLLGVGFAVSESTDASHEAVKAVQDAKAKGVDVRNVICEGLTEDDLETYKFVHQHPRGHGGLGELITPEILSKALQKNADRRRKLAYSPTPPACHASVTINPYSVVTTRPKT